MASPEAVSAIEAWVRLDQAFTAFNRDLDRHHGVTGTQLAIMRLVTEWGPDVRLVDLTADTADRRRRMVRLTDHGARVVRDAPLAGPVRLRQIAEDPRRLRR